MFAHELFLDDVWSDAAVTRGQQRIYKQASDAQALADDADESVDNGGTDLPLDLARQERKEGFWCDERGKPWPRTLGSRTGEFQPIVGNEFIKLPLAALLKKAASAPLVLRCAKGDIDVHYRSVDDLMLWDAVAARLSLPHGHILAISLALHEPSWRAVARDRLRNLRAYVRKAAVRIGERLQLGALQDHVVGFTGEDTYALEEKGEVDRHTRKGIHWRITEATTKQTKWQARYDLEGESQALLFPCGTRYGTWVAPRDSSTGPSVAKVWSRVPAHLKQLTSHDKHRIGYTLNFAALRYALQNELPEKPRLVRRLLAALAIQAAVPETAGFSKKKIAQLAGGRKDVRKSLDAQYRQLGNYKHVLLKIFGQTPNGTGHDSSHEANSGKSPDCSQPLKSASFELRSD